MSARSFAAWHPLRCTGTALPPQLLLVAKLLVLSLFLNGYVQKLPERWLPMWRLLDALPSNGVRVALVFVACAAGIALFLNRWVRTASFLVGLVFFLQPIVCRAHFFYADFFCALILMLIGLHQPSFGTTLVRLQFTVMYFGSGLNKLLDTDWWSGVFMQNWLAPLSPIYNWMSAHFPDMWLARALSWGTIAIELSTAVMLLRPRLWHSAIWIAIGFHAASVFFVGLTFGVFLSALLAAYPVFATWYGAGEVVLEYQPNKRSHGLLRRVSDALDVDGLFTWRTGAGDGLRLLAGQETWRGFAAFRRWVLLTPAIYVAFVALVASPKSLGKLILHVAPVLHDAHWKLSKLGLVLLAVFLAPLPMWRSSRRAQATAKREPRVTAPAS